MCLTCGCGEPNKKMGDANITYDDIKAAADANDLSISETVAKLQQATEFEGAEQGASSSNA